MIRAKVRRLITRNVWGIGFALTHVVLGLLAVMMSMLLGNTRPPNYIVHCILLACWGIIFGLQSLVGIWGALATCHWVARGTGFVVATSFVGTLLWLSMSGRSFSLVEVFGVTAAPLVVGASLSMARRAGIEVQRLDAADFTSCGPQFSLCQLTTLTAIVACLIAPRQWTGGWYPLPQIIVGFTSPWAILAPKRPLLGLVALCIVALGLGFGLTRPIHVTSLMAEMLLLASSLSLVRRRGFRITNRGIRTELGGSKAMC